MAALEQKLDRLQLAREPACHVAILPAAKRSFTKSILRLILI
jgi:hypothetical protein